MPTATYTPLATITLGSSASSVTFSSIPATYRDLVLVVGGSVSAGQSANLRFNGDTGSNYTRVFMLGTGSTTSSESGTSAGVLSLSGSQSVAIANIMDYSATDKHKTVLTRGNATSEFVIAFASRWANTAAITSVAASTTTGTFNSGTVFSLYGIAS